MDTGSQLSVAREGVIPEPQWTGQSVVLEDFTGGRRTAQLTSTQIRLKGRLVDFEFAVVPDLAHQLLFGRDLPGIWQLGVAIMEDRASRGIPMEMKRKDRPWQVTRIRMVGEPFPTPPLFQEEGASVEEWMPSHPLHPQLGQHLCIKITEEEGMDY